MRSPGGRAVTPSRIVVACVCFWASLSGAEKSKDSEKRQPNRLAKEKSPYLLQHAYNPVDWYPWGEQAFAEAKKTNRPVFLSIGYSTCHWCHVMERESFEDDEIAAFLNDNFICVKVDREERPDVDNVYMTSVQLLIGRGGWPLSVFLTPDGKPFYGGTYFPARDGDRGTQTGFLTLCRKVIEVWKAQKPVLLEQADKISAAVQEQAKQGLEGGELERSVLKAGFDVFAATHDPVHGGFGPAPRFEPKFPRTSTLDFLMRYAVTHPKDREQATEMVYRTLDALIRGGIRDHLAGGFHRYSVDRVWLIPHFEKMLYDQALITQTLVDAYRLSARERYRDVARATMDYVLERMTGPDGELYSAEDADTEHEEGKTYVWRLEQIVETLGEERGRRFAKFYGVTAEGNFEDAGPGWAVLHVAPTGDDVEEVAKEFVDDRATLLGVRDGRPQPLRDDKVLTAWNGLAISSLSGVYQITRERKYLEAARRAANFVLQRLSPAAGRLARRFRQGEVVGKGFLDDYAYFTQGLLDLYEAGFEPRWLEEALRFARATNDLFWDTKEGGFFSTSDEHEKLIVNTKEFYDGAVPSANSVAFLNLLRLRDLTESKDFAEKARTFAALTSGILKESPQAHPKILCGALHFLEGALRITLIGSGDDATLNTMVNFVHDVFLPAREVVLARDAAELKRLGTVVPWVHAKAPFAARAKAYVEDGQSVKTARDAAALRVLLTGE